jgi:hypothetical protein
MENRCHLWFLIFKILYEITTYLKQLLENSMIVKIYLSYVIC